MSHILQTKVVALGGGHGLFATLSALRRLSLDITAIVTVADNGGSSGRLRDEMGILPPGDLRMALAALCGDDKWGRQWADVLQHRFESSGELQGHAVGNLLIAALWQILDDHVAGLDLVGELLDAQGRVLPMSQVPLDIEADTRIDGEIRQVRGQVEVATTPGRIEAIRLIPKDPPATKEAVSAILDADFVVLGPGSWFTSVLPNLLVPEIRSALAGTTAKKFVVLNLAPQAGETEGFNVADHLNSLAEHADGLSFDIVLSDTHQDQKLVDLGAKKLGAQARTFDIASRMFADRHDPLLLAAAFRSVMDQTEITNQS